MSQFAITGEKIQDVKAWRCMRSPRFILAHMLLFFAMLTGIAHAQILADPRISASIDKSAAYTTETVTITAVVTNIGTEVSGKIGLNWYYPGTLESLTQINGSIETDIPVDSDARGVIYVFSELNPGDITTFTLRVKPWAGFRTASLAIGTGLEADYTNNAAPVPIMGLTSAPVDFRVAGVASVGLPNYSEPLLNWYTFQPFNFEVLVTNLGDTVVDAVTIGNTLSPAFQIDRTNVEIITGSAAGVSRNGATVSLESMGPGATCKIQFFGQAILGGNIANQTQVTCDSVSDLPVRQSVSVVDIKAVKNCDFSIVFDPLDGSTESGTIETFTAHVTNSGPDNAEMVPMSIIVPRTHAWDVISADNNGGVTNGDPNNTLIYWSFPLNVGETKTISFQARALGRGKVRSMGFGIPRETDEYFDPNPAGNSSYIDTEIYGGPDFHLVNTSTVSSRKIQLGGLLVHTMTVTNVGPDDATSITLHSFIGANPFGTGQIFELVSIEDAGKWDVRDLNRKILATLPSLAAGESAAITVVLKLNYYAGYGDMSVAFITVTEITDSDIGPYGNGVETILELTTEADPGADLFITRTATPDPGVLNQNLTYTVRGINLGPDPTTTAYLGNILPDGCTLVSATADKGALNINGNYVDVSGIPLAVGEAATLTMDVVPTHAGYITNHSGLSSADFDPDLNNNITAIDTQILESLQCAEAVDLSARLVKIKTKGKFKRKTGEWQFKVNARAEISNNGTECAPPTVVKLYLSDDPFFDGADVLIGTKNMKTICPAKKSKKAKFKVKLGNDQNPVGRYIIAVADGDNIIPECNEENNAASGF